MYIYRCSGSAASHTFAAAWDLQAVCGGAQLGMRITRHRVKMILNTTRQARSLPALPGCCHMPVVGEREGNQIGRQLQVVGDRATQLVPTCTWQRGSWLAGWCCCRDRRRSLVESQHAKRVQLQRLIAHQRRPGSMQAGHRTQHKVSQAGGEGDGALGQCARDGVELLQVQTGCGVGGQRCWRP